MFPLVVPPLRARREDIPLLATHFVREYAQRFRRPVPPVGAGVMDYLQAHCWPGNVRQLAYWMERMVILCEGASLEWTEVVAAEEMESELSSMASADARAAERPAEPPLAEGADEKLRIVAVLERTNWVVSGQRGAARLLDMSHQTLRYRMRKYGLQRPKH